MFHVMFSLPCLYVLVRFLWPMPWKTSAKLATALALLLASQYHLYSRLSSGSVFSPEFPRTVVILFNCAFSAILLLAVLQIIVDVVTLVAMLARRKRVAIPIQLRGGIGIAALLLAALGVQQAIRVPAIKDVEIAIADLPPQFEGYRILQLTDLHISRLFERPWTQAVVDRSNTLDVDLIVVTGDLIDGALEDRIADVAPLMGLRAPDGVYVVPGNHEYFFGYPDWMGHFASLGMTPLDNSHALIARDGAQLALAGVTDLSAPGAGFPAPAVDAAIAGVPADVTVILLDHQPRNARAAARHGIALQLSGHTHGGLVAGLDRVFAWANAGFVSGLYQIDAMQLYVNNGTALWPGMALRLGRPAELTRLTLRRAPGASAGAAAARAATPPGV